MSSNELFTASQHTVSNNFANEPVAVPTSTFFASPPQGSSLILLTLDDGSSHLGGCLRIHYHLHLVANDSVEPGGCFMNVCGLQQLLAKTKQQSLLAIACTPNL